MVAILVVGLRPLTGISASLTGYLNPSLLGGNLCLRPLTGISASLTDLRVVDYCSVFVSLRPLTGISASLTLESTCGSKVG